MVELALEIKGFVLIYLRLVAVGRLLTVGQLLSAFIGADKLAGRLAEGGTRVMLFE